MSRHLWSLTVYWAWSCYEPQTFFRCGRRCLESRFYSPWGCSRAKCSLDHEMSISRLSSFAGRKHQWCTPEDRGDTSVKLGSWALVTAFFPRCIKISPISAPKKGRKESQCTFHSHVLWISISSHITTDFSCRFKTFLYLTKLHQGEGRSVSSPLPESVPF